MLLNLLYILKTIFTDFKWLSFSLFTSYHQCFLGAGSAELFKLSSQVSTLDKSILNEVIGAVTCFEG